MLSIWEKRKKIRAFALHKVPGPTFAVYIFEYAFKTEKALSILEFSEVRTV